MPLKDYNEIITMPLGPAKLYAMALPKGGVRSSSRSVERAAVSHIIEHVFGLGTELLHNPDGAPYIANTKKFISISHGGGYALLAVCDTLPIGFDIECYRPQLKRVAAKFLAPQELEIYSASESLLLQAWTSKEAIFKSLGISGLTISEIILPNNPDTTKYISHSKEITLHRHILNDSMITLAVATQHVSDKPNYCDTQL